MKQPLLALIMVCFNVFFNLPISGMQEEQKVKACCCCAQSIKQRCINIGGCCGFLKKGCTILKEDYAANSEACNDCCWNCILSCGVNSENGNIIFRPQQISCCGILLDCICIPCLAKFCALCCWGKTE